MTKILAKIIYKIIWGFDYIFKKITKRSFLIWFKDFIEETSYKTIKINGKDITFFTPNYISSWLISEFYSTEPETIEWIDNFKISGKKGAENLDAYKDKKLEKVYNYFFDKK